MLVVSYGVESDLGHRATLPQSARVVQRIAERVLADSVRFRLSRLHVDTRAAHRLHLNRFIRYLHKQPDWEHASPRECAA